MSTKRDCATLNAMGKILLDDFIKQRKFLSWLLLSAVLATAVGFAFREIYDCVGLILTAGTAIIYLNSYFDLPAYMSKQNQVDRENNDPLINVLKRKTYFRTKFVEIITLSIVAYILMYVAFVLDAMDTDIFNDPAFSMIDNISKIMFYPLILMFITSIITPFLTKYKMSRTGFIGLALLSFLLLYGIFMTNFFVGLMDMKWTMTIAPPVVLGILFVCYIISISIISRRK